MNKTFKNNSRIELDSKYYIEADSDNGVVLVFSENREREKTKKENGKIVKTDEKEDYLFEERLYFPRIAQSLKAYVNKSLNNSSSLQEIIEKEDLITSLINKLDKEFKQF